MDDKNAMLLAEAERLLAGGDVDKAIRSILAILRESPNSYQAHLKLAEGYHRKGSGSGGVGAFLKLAEREFGTAWKLVPPGREAHMALLETGAKLGRLSSIMEEYRNRLKELPFAGEMVEMGEAIEAAGKEAAGSTPGKPMSFGELAKSPVFWGGMVLAVVVISTCMLFTGRRAGPGPVGTRISIGGDESGEADGVAPNTEYERESRTRSHINMLRSAISIYYADTEGRYPPNLDCLVPKYIPRIPPVMATHSGVGRGEAESPAGNSVLVTTDMNISVMGQGWRYNPEAGWLFVNSCATDSRGVPYSTYGY